MTMHRMLGIALLCGSCASWATQTSAQSGASADRSVSNILSLSGNDWRIHDDPDATGMERGLPLADIASTNWIAAQVPGNIQSDLETAHQLKPLWYGDGDSRLCDVARKDWWYRKDFVVPSHFAGRRLTLVFDGVDHECDVWMNGKPIGRNVGMFRRFWFDVTELAQPGKVNRLALRIRRMPEQLLPLFQKTDGSGVNGEFLSGVEQTMHALKELKSPTNWGWDWGTNVWTLGIWKDVRLEATGSARIAWTRVQTTLSDDRSKAVATASLEIESQAEMPAKAQFRITGNGATATATVEGLLKKGQNLLKAELTLDRPALWWPNGQGDQPLYELHAELQPANGGDTLDTRDVRFGVRDVRWIHTEGAPADFVSRYQLVINGRPVRTMGSNLIPPDLLFGRMGPRSLHLIRRAKDAGMNVLRVWGGGVILHDDAYDLADQLGIMLVVELPLANYWPDTDAEFLDNLEATARNIFKQVRNHPSIIEFDGGNEMPWNSLTKHAALQLLQKVAAEENNRLFRATCADLGATHGPWFFDLRTNCRYFQELNTMRAGEFGAASPANLEVWHRDIPPKSQWPIVGEKEPTQVHKNIVQAVFDQDYWLRKKFIDSVFGPLDNLSDLVEAGQLYGAEGLRCEIDTLRCKGKRLGGLTTWDFNEPWTNGAGSYLVDYDGRTLMNYDFYKQAIAPISLSLRYDSIFYRLKSGVKAELFLVSDAPRAASGLRWKWLARDRRGQVFAQNSGAASIDPLEVKSLGTVELKPPAATVFGPIFVEMRLEDSNGKLLGERLQMFGLADVVGPLAGLLKNREADSDDNVLQVNRLVELPDGEANLAFVGNGAKPAEASSARSEPIHQPKGINDGVYGNDFSWIGASPRSSFQIDLGKQAALGCFKLGRDRSGVHSDRALDYVKIETSLDGKTWQTVFERNALTGLESFGPGKTLTVHVVPVQARFVKATVDSKNSAAGEIACVDEFEVYAPAKQPPAALPTAEWKAGSALETLWRPVRRTALQVTVLPMRVEGDHEILEMQVKNVGPMTALFCEPHPVVEYRTDLFIDNNHCFVPPGESRTITIRAAKNASRSLAVGNLSLAQTGWRISCWNADDILVEPDAGVLLALGRRDRMCREYLGYSDPSKVVGQMQVKVEGPRPNPARVPYILDSQKSVRFEFNVSEAQSKRPLLLRIHAADQSAKTPAKVVATINGRPLEGVLPQGLGIQQSDPAHLAFPATLELPVKASCMQSGKNVLEVGVQGDGWFSWDSLDLR